ncbi:M20 family metallopeptidase [candidate division KSB1 bacterium]
MRTKSNGRNNWLPAILLAVTSLYITADLVAQQSGIDEAVRKFESEIVRLREQIHQNPELPNREFKTAALVAGHLRALGMEVTTGVAHTGVIGLLRGGKPGPVVAVRADMDALPVTEDTPFPFKSTVRTMYLGKEVGVMHACGHDIHTAVQLGVASVLSSMRDELPGTVKFIFQPAEEGAPPGEEGGAQLMFDEGVLDNPRPGAIFGLHALAGMDVGKTGFTTGPALAAVDHFTITLRGKQAHGASPHTSIDPIVMGAQAVMALQTIRSRTLPPLEPSVVTVGIFRSGERFNIIPAEVYMEGTVRTYDEKVRDTIEQRMTEILDGITQAYGGSYTMDYNRGTPATINDPSLAEKMLPALERLVGKENLMTLEPTMGGEDFAVFANEIPGFFLRLGQNKPGTVSGGHHTPTYQADNSCIAVGMRIMSTLLLDYLSSGGIEK